MSEPCPSGEGPSKNSFGNKSYQFEEEEPAGGGLSGDGMDGEVTKLIESRSGVTLQEKAPPYACGGQGWMGLSATWKVEVEGSDMVNNDDGDDEVWVMISWSSLSLKKKGRSVLSLLQGMELESGSSNVEEE